MKKVYDIYCLRQPFLSGRGDPDLDEDEVYSYGLSYGEGHAYWYGLRQASGYGGGDGYGDGHGIGECYGSVYGDGNLHELGFSKSAIGIWQDPCIK